ncbi:MAG: hypothetical protein V4674_02425 [Patescibacteria group bacterium]
MSKGDMLSIVKAILSMLAITPDKTLRNVHELLLLLTDTYKREACCAAFGRFVEEQIYASPNDASHYLLLNMDPATVNLQAILELELGVAKGSTMLRGSFTKLQRGSIYVVLINYRRVA